MLGALRLEVLGVGEGGLDSQKLAGDLDRQEAVQLRQVRPATPRKDLFEEVPVALEMRSVPIVSLDQLPVGTRPMLSHDFHVLDQVVARIARHRHRDPKRSARALELVAIAPAAGRIAYVVIEDEQIHVMDDVEITLPGQVAGLDHGNTAHMVRIPSRGPRAV